MSENIFPSDHLTSLDLNSSIDLSWDTSLTEKERLLREKELEVNLGTSLGWKFQKSRRIRQQTWSILYDFCHGRGKLKGLKSEKPQKC